MNLLSSKTSRWIVLTPIVIMLFFSTLIVYYMNWSQKNRVEILTKSAKKSHHERVLKNSHIKMDEIISALNEAKYFDANLENDNWLSENLRFTLSPSADYAYVFRLDKKNKQLKTLFSNNPKILSGDVLTKPSKIIADGLVLDKLLQGSKTYRQKKLSDMDFLSILLVPYENTTLVMGIGIISVPFEMEYLAHIDKHFQATTKQRNIIFAILFCLFSIISWLIAFYVKKLNDSFEKSKQKLNNKNLKLNKLLYIDSQTNLYNEKMLHQKIEKLESPKLILIEVDEYETISEYSGHRATEEIVAYMKRNLLDFCKEFNEFSMELFRISNSQFALLENAPLDMERYEEIAFRLVTFLKGATIINPADKEMVDFNCTIGFSIEEASLFETARIALRRAISDERDYLCYFKNIGGGEEYKREAISADFIKRALENDRVVPFFQPIFDKDKNITKHECLVRILGDNHEIVAPRIFLDVSRKIKRYSEIEKSLVEKSLRCIENTDKVISINLSSRDMTDSNVSNFVVEKINQYNLGKQVIFEILEDENIRSINRVASFIKRVKSMGVRIAIDDFGSGYSNFSYMLELEPDFIKIDGTLIKNITHDARSYAIVDAILTFARQLGIGTIAEFIHNEEVFEACKNLGIDEFQGFYLAEPSPNLL